MYVEVSQFLLQKLIRIQPHIVDYIASQGWESPRVEIFMGLLHGTLESLIENGNSHSVADAVFNQMLQALDCLAFKNIIHRDIKPENILYFYRSDGQLEFKLGDFGLCNRTISAATLAGSPLYMAPEMFEESEQTHKVDVWSLFVTMLWTLDINGFRKMSKQFKSTKQVKDAVLLAASNNIVAKIREMGVINPKERASAAQMLIKCFDGVGLITPKHQVPPLVSHTENGISTASPVIATRPLKGSKGLAKRKVEKPRIVPQTRRRILPKPNIGCS
jgi:serine/threonine protein kinase